MRYMAIDASTKRSGYCLQYDDGRVEYGVISNSSTIVEKRIAFMRDEFKKILKEFNPDIVVIEDVRPDGGNAHTGKILNWLQGIIAIAVYENNPKCKFEMLGATSWRSKIGLQGYRITRERQKQMDIDYANKHYGLSLTSEQDDEADALDILSAYLNGATSNEAPASKDEIGSGKSAF